MKIYLARSFYFTATNISTLAELNGVELPRFLGRSDPSMHTESPHISEVHESCGTNVQYKSNVRINYLGPYFFVNTKTCSNSSAYSWAQYSRVPHEITLVLSLVFKASSICPSSPAMHLQIVPIIKF